MSIKGLLVNNQVTINKTVRQLALCCDQHETKKTFPHRSKNKEERFIMMRKILTGELDDQNYDI